jgi:hypothetical protein
MDPTQQSLAFQAATGLALFGAGQPFVSVPTPNWMPCDATGRPAHLERTLAYLMLTGEVGDQCYDGQRAARVGSACSRAPTKPC